MALLSTALVLVLFSGAAVGAPAFAAPVNHAVPGPASSVVTGDFNGDGVQDLAVMDGVVSILLGRGDGSLQSPVSYTMPVSPDDSRVHMSAEHAAVGDLNGDASPDLAVIATYPSVISFGHPEGDVCTMLGGGDGTFSVGPCVDAGAETKTVVATDMNGDGRLDLVAANEGCSTCAHIQLGSVAVLLGHGDGTFGPRVLYGAHYDSPAVAVGDLNGDGAPDVVAVNDFTNNTDAAVQVFLGKGDGTLGTPTSYGFPNDLANAVAVADVNGDGRADVLAATPTAPSGATTLLAVLLGNGDGTLGTPTYFPVSSAPFGFPGETRYSLTAADVDGDGHVDAVLTDSVDALVLPGAGDGTFGAPLAFPADTTPRWAAVADLNGDGALDLAVANFGSSDVSVLLNAAGSPPPSKHHHKACAGHHPHVKRNCGKHKGR
jgi:hypothetical protein